MYSDNVVMMRVAVSRLNVEMMHITVLITLLDICCLHKFIESLCALKFGFQCRNTPHRMYAWETRRLSRSQVNLMKRDLSQLSVVRFSIRSSIQALFGVACVSGSSPVACVRRRFCRHEVGSNIVSYAGLCPRRSFGVPCHCHLIPALLQL